MPSVWSAVTPVSTACGVAALEASTSVIALSVFLVSPQDRAANSVCSLPPCGGGVGRGVVVVPRGASSNTDPHPNPSPQGGGAHRVRGTVLHHAQRSARQSLLSPCCHLRRCSPNHEIRMAASRNGIMAVAMAEPSPR